MKNFAIAIIFIQGLIIILKLYDCIDWDWPLVVAPIEVVWIGLFVVMIGVGIVNIMRWE